MKKWCVVLVVFLVLGLAQGTLAKNLIDTQSIKQEPVNVLYYAYEGMDFGLTVLIRLLKTGKPIVMWNKENEQGVGGLSLVLIEGLLHERLDLVGGATMENEHPSHTFWGIEAKLSLKSDLGKTLSNFRPGVYWSQGKWWYGVSLALRGLSITK